MGVLLKKASDPEGLTPDYERHAAAFRLGRALRAIRVGCTSTSTGRWLFSARRSAVPTVKIVD